jgi:hypothetical protein
MFKWLSLLRKKEVKILPKEETKNEPKEIDPRIDKITNQIKALALNILESYPDLEAIIEVVKKDVETVEEENKVFKVEEVEPEKEDESSDE